MRSGKVWTLLVAAAFLLVGCDPYSGFGAICSEGHPAVARARSLSQEQLSFLYAEIFRLRAENGAPSMMEYSGAEIPQNLRFLEAA